MPASESLTEFLSLRAMAELERFEADVELLVKTDDPEAWALLLRLFGHHWNHTMEQMAKAMHIDEQVWACEVAAKMKRLSEDNSGAGPVRTGLDKLGQTLSKNTR